MQTEVRGHKKFDAVSRGNVNRKITVFKGIFRNITLAVALYQETES